MKPKFKITYILSVILFLTVVYCNAQSVAIYQSIKLAVMNDDYGNKPFTTNVIGQLLLKGNEQTYGQMIIYPEFEL